MFGRSQGETLVNRRDAKRQDYRGECRIQLDCTSYRGRCMNISPNGASLQLRSLGTLKKDQAIRFHIGYLPPLDARIRWTRDRSIGVEFTGSDDGYASLKNLLAEIENAQKD